MSSQPCTCRIEFTGGRGSAIIHGPCHSVSAEALAAATERYEASVNMHIKRWAETQGYLRNANRMIGEQAAEFGRIKEQLEADLAQAQQERGR